MLKVSLHDTHTHSHTRIREAVCEVTVVLSVCGRTSGSLQVMYGASEQLNYIRAPRGPTPSVGESFSLLTNTLDASPSDTVTAEKFCCNQRRWRGATEERCTSRRVVLWKKINKCWVSVSSRSDPGSHCVCVFCRECSRRACEELEHGMWVFYEI